MKPLGGLLIIVFVISACKKSNDCTAAQYKYNSVENKKIDTVRLGGYLLWPQINSGNNIVFTYSLLSGSCRGRSDGSGGEYLIFEIPGNTTSFNYSSIDIQNIQCYYGYLGWATSDAMKIVEGTIKGNKLSANAWIIGINIPIAGRGAPLSFKKQFTFQ
jgi:hypothetical protein